MRKIIFTAFLLLSFIANAQVRNYKNGTRSDVQVAKQSLRPKSDLIVKTSQTVKPVKEPKKQQYDDDSESKSSFGIIASVNISNEHAVVGELNNPTSRTGFNVGIAYKTKFSNFVGMGFNLTYANMGADFNSEFKDELDYIQLPVFLTLGGKVFKVKIGPQIGYLISANFDGEDYIDTLNSFDYGAYVGLEIQIPKTKIAIAGGYYQGLANINTTASSLEIWNKSYSFGLIYYFK